MKTRTGFVSNSSSSSFVVAFKEPLPKDAAEVKSLLFGEEDSISCYGDPVSTKDAAEQVFSDMQKAKPMTDDEVAKEVSSGYYDGYPDYPAGIWNLPKEEYRKAWDDHKVRVREGAKSLAREFLSKNKGLVFLRFRYSDNEGEFGSTMEHGGVFDKLPNIRVSHH